MSLALVAGAVVVCMGAAAPVDMTLDVVSDGAPPYDTEDVGPLNGRVRPGDPIRYQVSLNARGAARLIFSVTPAAAAQSLTCVTPRGPVRLSVVDGRPACPLGDIVGPASAEVALTVPDSVRAGDKLTLTTTAQAGGAMVTRSVSTTVVRSWFGVATPVPSASSTPGSADPTPSAGPDRVEPARVEPVRPAPVRPVPARPAPARPVPRPPESPGAVAPLLPQAPLSSYVPPAGGGFQHGTGVPNAASPGLPVTPGLPGSALPPALTRPGGIPPGAAEPGMGLPSVAPPAAQPFSAGPVTPQDDDESDVLAPLADPSMRHGVRSLPVTAAAIVALLGLLALRQRMYRRKLNPGKSVNIG